MKFSYKFLSDAGPFNRSQIVPFYEPPEPNCMRAVFRCSLDFMLRTLPCTPGLFAARQGADAARMNSCWTVEAFKSAISVECCLPPGATLDC
ncbi:hypothetical protein NPIL_273251 [Nephila pilipes]|uniref:Uncharacterized protein n=1 Tax=Nephila pilipes TaxID=299642 RepID=A0A8X6NHP5_NEPPI|nr:hypothetical protein NPIL_273251 [Nephila pilipes]